MTRRVRILFGVTGCTLVVLAAPYLFWHPVWLNHGGYEQIQPGMTEPEVEQLMGGPPGMYYPTYLGAGGTMTEEGYDVPDAAETVWSDDKRRYEIWFDDGGRVVGKHRRSGWSSSSVTCRLTGMMGGVRKPVPLETRRYRRANPTSK